MNVENFISAASLDEMKKVKAKNGVKKFEQWLKIARKADFNETAPCAEHLKKCLI